jgi:hypothetical protein
MMQPVGITDEVVEQLSTASCDHELACNNTGPGRQFTSLDACASQMRLEVASELGAYRCPAGLDRAALGQCTMAIIGERCDQPVSTLPQIEKCRSAALCMTSSP